MSRYESDIVDLSPSSLLTLEEWATSFHAAESGYSD